MIKVRDLRKVFRVHRKEPGLAASVRSLFRRNWVEKEAVTGSSFDVKEGEIVGLIGANGAGKTTLVKMLSGIIHPTSGEAEVLGHVPWHRQDDFRRQIALVMGQKAQMWWESDSVQLNDFREHFAATEFDRLISYLHDNLDLTILMITHDVDSLFGICDRIAVMQRGKIVEQGEPADLFTQPKAAYTRELLAAVPGREWQATSTTPDK